MNTPLRGNWMKLSGIAFDGPLGSTEIKEMHRHADAIINPTRAENVMSPPQPTRSDNAAGAE